MVTPFKTEGKIPMIANELDLHGYTTNEAMEMFDLYYQDQLKQGKKPFNVIHGYGSKGSGGEIRKKLRAFLSAHPDKATIYLGEQTGGNLGTTQVKPIKPLPSRIDILEDKILDYCHVPRTKDKIAGKFRNYGAEKVSMSIKKLEQCKILKPVIKGKFKCYIAD